MDRPSIHKSRFPKTTKSVLLLCDHTAQLWELNTGHEASQRCLCPLRHLANPLVCRWGIPQLQLVSNSRHN